MSLRLNTPDTFTAFPFLPYDIQLDLMQHLYSSIEDSKVTVVESPTGTGKTLSLLCSALTWLRDEQDRARKGKLVALASDGTGPDWIITQTIERQRRELEAVELEHAERLAAARRREAKLRKLARGRVRKRPKVEALQTEIDADDDTFLPDASDDEDEPDGLSPAVRALMKKLSNGAATTTPTEPEPTCTKIYYASRTHSQLAQVLHELLKLKLNLSVSLPESPCGATTNSSRGANEGNNERKRGISTLDDSDESECAGVARTVSLGSRKQLCVNEKLRERGGDLDEACRQMLSEKGTRRCAYLPPADEETKMLDLRDQILATPKDIEELALAGQDAQTCPYFGARRAIPQAQLVLLPYNLLLQKAARESLGIDVTNQVVIIDEAHNLISTLLSLSTTSVRLGTFRTALRQLKLYLDTFRLRLTTQHALHLRRLVGMLDALVTYAEEWGVKHADVAGPGTKGKYGAVEVMTSGALLHTLGRKVEGMNLLEIEGYLRSSKIARKISGYSTKAMTKAAGADSVKLAKVSRLSATTPPLHAVQNFIAALTEANDDGRVTFCIIDGQVEIKYQHLNPSTHFQELVDTARSVVLAGGTMSPVSDFTNQLFGKLATERLTTFSCGHIIPATNLQTLVLKKGPRGGELLFKYEQRNNNAVISELGQILLNFSSIVPAGMVVFVPSYSFLHSVRAVWQENGMMERLKGKKQVFVEPQDSSEVEAVLRDYAAEIQRRPDDGTARSKGALLFAVIGAKLSEGLNFTDDLARAVIIIGLPFANLASPELRERMNYVNRLEDRRRAENTRIPGATKDAATELYENMCMNAVNQSIGRAIRHRGDWASLVLVDGRYSSPRIRAKLPKWIGMNTVLTESFGQAMKEMGRFYRDKRGNL